MLDEVIKTSVSTKEVKFEKHQDRYYELVMKNDLKRKLSKKSLSIDLKHKESVLGSKNTLPAYYDNY